MTKEETLHIVEQITNDIRRIKNPSVELDISDLGNSIGFVVSNFFKKEEDLEDFLAGLKHGFELRGIKQ